MAPLRIQVLSDLHIDVARAELRLAPVADVVVVAGDTCEGVERGLAWLRAAVPAPTPIITVAGNHEYHSRATRGSDKLESSGITVAEGVFDPGFSGPRIAGL